MMREGTVRGGRGSCGQKVNGNASLCIISWALFGHVERKGVRRGGSCVERVKIDAVLLTVMDENCTLFDHVEGKVYIGSSAGESSLWPHYGQLLKDYSGNGRCRLLDR